MQEHYGKYKLPFLTNKRLDKPSGKDAARLCNDLAHNSEDFKKYPFQVIQDINNHIKGIDNDASGISGLSTILLASSAFFGGLAAGSFIYGEIEGGVLQAIIATASGWGAVHGYRSEQAHKRAKKLAIHVRDKVTDTLAERCGL